MLKITKQEEPIQVGAVKILLYGQPGSGKTSSAFTASNPLLLDTDNGSYRSFFRKDVVQVSAWTDIANITAEDVAEYDTIAIDTVGRLLDYLSVDIIKNNPKMGFNGALTLQGYGQLKAIFAGWINRLVTIGKDIIMISHDKEDKKGDNIIVRPDIQGGSYAEVFKLADSVGYMYQSEKGTILDFRLTSDWIGKNTAGLEPIVIPNFNTQPSFMADIIEKTKSAINTFSEEQQAIVGVVNDYHAVIQDIKELDELNSLLEEVGKVENDIARKQVGYLMTQKAKELGFSYDKKESTYVAAK